MNHFISVERAKKMNARYRKEKEGLLAPEFRGKGILANSESFSRSAFDRILMQPDCIGIRIYYGMDEEQKVHAVVVGYDSEDKDILPGIQSAQNDEDDFEGVVEEGTRCPDNCPPESPLNEDKP